MIIGFSGTRKGMTKNQKKTVNTLLKYIKPVEVHHGDNIGADKEFHIMSRKLKIRIFIHPPIKNNMRAFCEIIKNDYSYDPKPYLVRDKSIVLLSDLLFIAPDNKKFKYRAYNSFIYNYANKHFKKIIIIWSSGQIESRNL